MNTRPATRLDDRLNSLLVIAVIAITGVMTVDAVRQSAASTAELAKSAQPAKDQVVVAEASTTR
jgi:uncharacterized membrane protein